MDQADIYIIYESRHSRAGGNPRAANMDSRLRGNDGNFGFTANVLRNSKY